MSRSLNERRKGPRIASDILIGGLWTWVLYATADKGVQGFWESVLFGLALVFIGVNLKDIADAITEPEVKDGAP